MMKFWTLAIMQAVMFVTTGCNLVSLPDKPGGDEPNPPDVEPDKPDSFPESDYWSALADQIEAGLLGNTDLVMLTAKRLEKLGRLKDLDRLSEFASKRVDITEANRESIAKTVRGE